MKSTQRLPLLVACLAASLSPSTIANMRAEARQATRNISVEDPRPLAAVIRKLESELGEIITYEDPPYSDPSGYKDVTETVTRDPHPRRRTLVPQGGHFDFSYQIRDDLPTGRERTRDVLQLLVQAYSRSHPAVGAFGVTERAGTYHVVPILATGRGGIAHSYDSLLDTRITMAPTETNGLAALEAIASAVSTRSKRKLLVGMVPINVLYHTKVSFVGVEEAARDALLGALNSSGVRLSWQILCAPGDEPNDCYLNVYGQKA